MKKIFIASLAAVMSVTLGISAFAAQSTVSFKTGSGELSHSFEQQSELEYAMNAKELFEDFGKSDNGSVKLTVTYQGLDSYNTELFIKLDALALPQNGQITPLNYYSFTVKDKDGNDVMGPCDDAQNDARAKELPIAVLSGSGILELDVTYTADTAKKASVDLSKLGISLLIRRADKLEAVPATKAPATAAPTQITRPTPRPKFDFDELSEQAGLIFGTDDNQGSENQTPDKQIVKVCGKDIPPGRYVVSGSGNLKITRANGTVKGEAQLNGNKGVVLLEVNDVISISPLNGQEKAKLRFDVASSTTGDVEKITPQDKTNPKTGDDDSATAIAISVAVLALAAFAGLEILKRKKSN